MAKDREQELERLNKELLKTQKLDPSLQPDIPIEILEPVPITWEDTREPQQDEDLTVTAEELTITPEDLADYTETPLEQFAPTVKKKSKKAHSKKQEDKSLTILMAIACFLCISIIGVLVYWLEVFLK